MFIKITGIITILFIANNLFTAKTIHQNVVYEDVLPHISTEQLDYKIEVETVEASPVGNIAEESKEIQKEPVKTETKEINKESTKTTKNWSRFVRGKNHTYQSIYNYCITQPNCVKLRNAFLNKYNEDVADQAMIGLYFENGTFWQYTVGVCRKKYQIKGDYRNCNYADMNSAGLDVGLKQINTFYQQKRIEKLGGPKCKLQNSKDRADKCNQLLIDWLHNIDNNIAISLDLYSEQGFYPWYGWKAAFK